MFREALRILLRSFGDLWDNLYVLTVANLLWSLSLAPGLGVDQLIGGLAGLIVGFLLLAIIAGPVTMGLFALTTDVTRRERLEYGEIFRGIRQYWRRGMVLGIINMLFAVLTIVNVYFYSNNIPPLLIVWAYIVFTWFVGQFYLWPLMVRMEKVNPIKLFTNTLLCTFKYPALSLTLGFVMLVILGISYYLFFLPVMVFVLIYFTLVSNKALSVVLEREAIQVAKLREEGIDAASPLSSIPIPEPELPPEPTFTAKNPPPGVKRRGSR